MVVALMAMHNGLVHIGDNAYEPAGIKRQSQTHLAGLVDADIDFDDAPSDRLALARDDLGPIIVARTF